MDFFRKKQNIQTKKGMFIPQSVQDAAPERVGVWQRITRHVALPKPTLPLSLPARPAFIAVPATLALLAFGFFAIQSVPAQSLPAAPIVVIEKNYPYERVTLTEGVNEDLSDAAIFQQVVTAYKDANKPFLVLDMPERTLTYTVEGKEVFAANVVSLPETSSWLYPKSGRYSVKTSEARAYDAIHKQYYANALRFGTNFLIHGNIESVDGEVKQGALGGVQIADIEAADLARLVAPDAELLVRVTTTERAADKFSYKIKGPAVNARAYVVADIESGVVLFEDGAQKPLPIASLTKLMTAVVVAESYDVNSRITLDQEKYVTTLIPRLEGRAQANVFSLLQLLLVESSNEAAEVLATHVGRDAFIAKMNAKAEELGLSETTFTDPSGLDNDNVSSAHDLFLLTQYIAKEHPFLFAISVGDEAQFGEVNEFIDLDNFNVVDGLTNIIGGKIGETAAARQTSVSVHEYTIDGQQRRVAIIILGTGARTQSVQAVDHYIKSQYGAR